MSRQTEIPTGLYLALTLLLIAGLAMLHMVAGHLKWPIAAMALLVVNTVLPVIGIRRGHYQVVELAMALLISWIALSGLLTLSGLVAAAFCVHAVWALVHLSFPRRVRASGALLGLIALFDIIYAVWLIRGFEF